ncbi:MAG TPA: LysR family transcriptional regulator, partial [Rhizobiales bacterium]|nr:LysR family transcriptional regulator [Hyphomicrobiales bacterium]
MTIRYLKTFIAIAERGSFAAAARYLNLTQSAISMQM